MELYSGRLLALLWAVGLVAHCLLLGGYPASVRSGFLLYTVLLVGLELLRMLAGFSSAPRWAGPAGLCAAGFVVLLFAQVLLLAPASWLALDSSLVWLQLFAACWLAGRLARDPVSRFILLHGLLAAALICTALGFYQYHAQPHWLPLGRLQAPGLAGRASGGFAIPNSYAGLLLLLLPVCVVLALAREGKPWQRVLSAYVALVLFAGLLMSQSRGAWLSLAWVLAAWPLFRWRGRVAVRLGAALLVVCLSVWGLALWRQHSESARSRLDALLDEGGERTRPVMWCAALEIWRQAPVLGGGAGSYASRFEAFRPETMQTDPVHAHNEYLEVLAEQGLLGLFLLLSAFSLKLRAGWSSLEQQGFPSRALVAGLLAFACQLFLDFHLRIPALALCFGTCLGLLAPPRAGKELKGLVPRLVVYGLLAGLLVFLFLVALPYQRSEALRQRATSHGLGLSAPEKERLLRKALDLWPGHGQARADLSGVLVEMWTPVSTDALSLSREAEMQARKSLLASDIPWEAWARLGVSLDLQGRGLEAGACYLEALNRAPNRLQCRYFLAWHLSLNPVTCENAKALLQACLLLDPFHPQAQALLRQLQERKSLPASPP